MSLNDDKLKKKYINLKKKENNKTKLCKHINCKKNICNYSHSSFEQEKTANSFLFDMCIKTNMYIDIVKKIIIKFKKFYIENENKYRGIMLPSITLDNWIVNNTNYNIKNIDSLKDISYFGIVNVILYFHFILLKNNYGISPFMLWEIALCKETIRRNNVCKLWIDNKINQLLNIKNEHTCHGGINCVNGIHPSIEEYKYNNEFGIVWYKKPDIPMTQNQRYYKIKEIKKNIKINEQNPNNRSDNFIEDIEELFIMNKYYYVKNIYKEQFKNKFSRSHSLNDVKDYNFDCCFELLYNGMINNNETNIGLDIDDKMEIDENDYNETDEVKMDYDDFKDNDKIKQAFEIFINKWDLCAYDVKIKYNWVLLKKTKNKNYRLSPKSDEEKMNLIKYQKINNNCFQPINF